MGDADVRAAEGLIAEAVGSGTRALDLGSLDLSGADFAALAPAVRRIDGLRELYLGEVDEVPGFLAELTGLTRLGMRFSSANTLPEGLRRLTGLTELDLGYAELSVLPDWIGELTSLTKLDLSRNHLVELPESIGRLTALTSLDLLGNPLRALPGSIGALSSLSSLNLSMTTLRELPEVLGRLGALRSLHLVAAGLASLPESIGRLTGLTELLLSTNPLRALPDALAGLTGLRTLDVSQARLSELPGWIGGLTALTQLNLARNLLSELPGSIGRLTGLTDLAVSDNPDLRALPESLGGLSALRRLDANYTGLTALPDSIGELTGLRRLLLRDCELAELPESIGRLRSLERLDLAYNRLAALPEGISGLTSLTSLDLRGNGLTILPPGLGGLPWLQSLVIRENPLPPELLAVAGEGTRELWDFLRLLHTEGELIREAKLVLVGEGEVGKSSLLAALRGEEWVENRDTTHGIEIKPVEVRADGETITLNGWDFGGQQIYRPTHQLFFTEPAVYLVVWKPREGPELGQVDEWIRMIRHRAGSGARIHVVATHGGPGQRYAHIDEAAFRERYGEMIVDFHHVDSKAGGDSAAMVALKTSIGRTAAGLRHVTRWYPAGWRRLREALAARPEAYLRYEHYLEIARESGLTATSAGSLARNGHALGQWIHYADDPGLAELVILKADWLSVAIGLVLDDGLTNDRDGLLPHRRLAEIWTDPARDPAHRYPHQLQQMFLRLMERFELSYRVPELTGGEPLSLVAQLVRGNRPDLAEVWDGYRTGDPELVQILSIEEADTRRPVWPDGLMHRLIVLFHRHSLGRDDVSEAVHWAGGMVLRDRYGARALITLTPEGLNVRVRGLNPRAFLDHLVGEVRGYVEGFWKGLDTHVQIPCGAVCRSSPPGRGRFDLDKLYRRLGDGKREYPCSDPRCDEDAEIEVLLRGLDRRTHGELGLAELVREAVDGAMDSHVDRLIAAQDAATRRLLARLDGLDDELKEEFSRVEDRLTVLLRGLDDAAADGPRLFSLEPLDRSVWHPGVTTRRMRLTLWCEHSRLPVHMLDPDRPDAGVYTVEVPREWWVRAAPVVRAASVLLKAVLPVSLAAVELDLDANQWEAVKEQLALGKEVLGAAAEAGADAGVEAGAEAGRLLPAEPGGPSGGGTAGGGAAGAAGPGVPAPVRADGGLLRELHALLREQDIGYADLRRVRDAQGRFLWVHQRFVPVYQPPLPVIPVALTRLPREAQG